MAKSNFDVVIIGGGPGGYVAAIRAAQLGLKTAVVEKDHLGGICLNWGCIPAKALLRSSEIRHLLGEAETFGLRAGKVGIDLKQVVARSRQVVKKLTSGVAFLLKKNKVAVFDGAGRLDGPGRVRVEKEGKTTAELSAPHIILATGARARTLPGIEADGALVWTYREALVPDSLPKSLLVVGSGAIGMEFASFFHDLGSQVTVVEILDRILPVEDEEISDIARKSFEKQGMNIHVGTTLRELKAGKGQVRATLQGPDGEQEVKADRALLAVGITGNVEDIGIENSKARVEKGHVVVDQWLATDEPGLYAIGDLTAPPWLAHKASHEGVICVERIAGVADVHPLEPLNIPACTYCRPQIASVGLTEKAAKEAGFEVRVGRFPYIGNGKAIALGESEGLIKTVFDARTGALLGAHMIGAEVTELISGFTIARTLEATEADLMHTVFAHPTLSETLHESVLDAFGRALHV